MSQINFNNFFRWFTGSVVDETANFPRLGIQDAKIYLPQLVGGETVGFYLNADVPFFDADDFTQLELKAIDVNNVTTVVGAPGTLVKVPLADGYRLYASFALPNLSLGQYQLSIYNLATSTEKCRSNYFQVISAGDAFQYTQVKWRNSRDAYYYDWSQVPELYCQVRLALSLSGYQGEGTVDQTKAVSTGKRRNNNYDLDLSVKLSTYYFDDGANMACYPLFTADDIQLNGRSYLNKTLYLPNVRVVSKVNIGEIELYDQAFSQINKFGQLPQQVIGGNTVVNSYTILNNSADNLDVILGVTGGGVTTIATIAPNGIYQVLLSVLGPTNYITLSYTDADPLTTMAAIFVQGGSRSTSTVSPATQFGNVTYTQLQSNNFFMVFGTVNAVRATAWRGQASSLTCVLSGGANTGDSVYGTLEQYYTDTNSATGVTKANTIGDPDYIAPAADPTNCPAITFLTVTLNYNAGSGSGLCFTGGRIDYFTNPGDSHYYIGMLLFSDNRLTTIVPDGFYSDGTSLLTYTAGRITGISSC